MKKVLALSLGFLLWSIPALGGVVLFRGVASAQQLSVDINSAKLKWDAPVVCTTFPDVPLGCGGASDVYHVKCGDTTGSYNHPVVDVAAPNTEIEVKLIVPTLGEYFCAVSAENQFGVSGNSNEINFTVGATPGSPTNLSVVAQ